jgi:hypothetical protein
MGDVSEQLHATEDDCVYFYNKEKSKWQKVCDVDVLPKSILKQVKDIKAKAAAFPEVV